MYRLISKISCVGLKSAKGLKPVSSEVQAVLKVLLLSAAPCGQAGGRAEGRRRMRARGGDLRMGGGGVLYSDLHPACDWGPGCEHVL